MRRHFGIPLRAHHPLRTSLSICASTFGLELPRPIPPNVKVVGPILRKVKPLAEPLKKWFEESPNPVIYISMGSLATVNTTFACKLIETFNKKKVNILWSLPSDQLKHLPESLPNNFRIEDHTDQQNVLAHPKVNLFISHCGSNSVSESLYHNTPIIGCPFFCDQYYWAVRIEELGCGLAIDKFDFTAEELWRKTQTILTDNDDIFYRSAKHISNIMRTSGGVKRAADLVEIEIKSALC